MTTTDEQIGLAYEALEHVQAKLLESWARGLTMNEMAGLRRQISQLEKDIKRLKGRYERETGTIYSRI